MRTTFSDGFMYDRASPYYQERRERQYNSPMELNLVPANIIERISQQKHRYHGHRRKFMEYAPQVLICIALFLALSVYSQCRCPAPEPDLATIEKECYEDYTALGC